MAVQEFHVWDCDIRDVQRLVGIWLYERVIMGLSVKRAITKVLSDEVRFGNLEKGMQIDEGLYGEAAAFTMSRGDGLRGCTLLESTHGRRSLGRSECGRVASATSVLVG
jgi:hypothetical protein